MKVERVESLNTANVIRFKDANPGTLFRNTRPSSDQWHSICLFIKTHDDMAFDPDDGVRGHFAENELIVPVKGKLLYED